MAYYTFLASTFANTSAPSIGVLQHILNRACPAGTQFEQILGTGDGSQVTFSGTLSYPTIAKGQCRIRYTIGATEYELWDNGNDTFHAFHEVDNFDAANCTINYATGAVSVKFKYPIINGYIIKALYSNGVEGADWLILRQTTTKNSTGGEAFSGLLLQETVLKNSGISYKEFICIGIREYQTTATSVYNWNINAYKQWDKEYETATDAWNSNKAWHGKSTYSTVPNGWNLPSVCFKSTSVNSFVSINKRRIIGIFKSSNTIYTSTYLGGYTRFVEPDRLKIPTFIIGNTNNPTVNYTSTALLSIHGRQNIHGFFIEHDTNNCLLIGTGGTPPEVHQIVPTYVDKINVASITKTVDGKIPLEPIYIVYRNGAGVDYNCVYGELDGYYTLASSDISAEDNINDSTNDHLVVPDIYRTSYLDFGGLKCS
jgi:hypothetical protein